VSGLRSNFQRSWIAFEQSPHGSLLVDAQSLQILSTNAALRQRLGLDEDELRALTLPQLFAHNGDAKALIRSGKPLTDQGSSTSPEEAIRREMEVQHGYIEFRSAGDNKLDCS
jgi:hypothetical protein